MRNLRIAVARLFPSLCTLSGIASYVSGESLATRIQRCSGGDDINGKKLMLIHEECVCSWPVGEESLGDVKSSRRRFGPGWRYTSALKWESQTGHWVDGKLSWWWYTVRWPSTGRWVSAHSPKMRRTF